MFKLGTNPSFRLGRRPFEGVYKKGRLTSFYGFMKPYLPGELILYARDSNFPLRKNRPSLFQTNMAAIFLSVRFHARYSRSRNGQSHFKQRWLPLTNLPLSSVCSNPSTTALHCMEVVCCQHSAAIQYSTVQCCLVQCSLCQCCCLQI